MLFLFNMKKKKVCFLSIAPISNYVCRFKNKKEVTRRRRDKINKTTSFVGLCNNHVLTYIINSIYVDINMVRLRRMHRK